MPNRSPDDQEPEYYADFQDVIAQRTIAFCSLARVAAEMKDEAVKHICTSMLQKISASIRTPASAEVRLITTPDPDSTRD